MIPDGWKRKSLGEVIILQRGFDLPEQDRIHGTIPIISSSGITGFHNESKVSSPGIVTGRYGTIGKVFLVDVDFWPLNTSLWVKDFYGNDHRYVYYLLQIIDYKKLSDKTGVPGINRNDVHKLRVLLPPLLEQCKIAEVLGVWDESIDLLEKLIGKTRSRKQGLMQQLLTGKKRFKEFEGSEWEKYKQSQVAHFHNGRAYKLSEWEEAGTPVIRLQNLTGTGKNFYYSNLELPEHQYVNSGDLLYMWSATFGPHIWKGERAIYHYHIWKVVCNDNLLSKNFFYFLLDFETQQKMSKSNGMGILHITKSTMESTQVILPSLAEQEKIAAVLSAADEEISTLEKQLTAYKQQKLGLMQQLLTGKIRVGMI